MNLYQKLIELSNGGVIAKPSGTAGKGLALNLTESTIGGYSFDWDVPAAVADADAANGLAGGLYNLVKLLAQSEDALNVDLTAGNKLDSFSFQQGTSIQVTAVGVQYLQHTATVRVRVPVTPDQPTAIKI